MQSQSKTDIDKARELQELMNIFSKVEVSISLLEVIRYVPKYVKFLNDLCTHKRKLKGNELFTQYEKIISALIQPMPQKCKDPVVFTLPYAIGNYYFGDAMLDLGTSINIMPKFVF